MRDSRTQERRRAVKGGLELAALAAWCSPACDGLTGSTPAQAESGGAQAAALLLAPATLSLALGAALLGAAGAGAAGAGFEPGSSGGARLLWGIVAPLASALGLAACLCWPLGMAAGFLLAHLSADSGT